eukprot:gene44954-60005_t
MWWLWILGVVVTITLVILRYIYRAATRIKATPVSGIPCPPLTHALLGHPEKMLHPLRHEFRLEVCDAANCGVHQLLMMKHVSVFINDCKEAARALLEFKDKGPIYTAFRFDPNIPDLFASDNQNWASRHKALTPALVASFASLKDITTDLLALLEKKCESTEPLDLMRLFTMLSFDVMCKAVFNYDLRAVAGSEEGARLADSLDSLVTAQASQGYFPIPGVRKVPPEEIAAAKNAWKAFLDKIVAVQRSEAEQFRSKHGALDPSRNFGHALLTMSENDEKFTAAHIQAEVHQVLRHGHECLAGQLCWLFVALHRNLK